MAFRNLHTGENLRTEYWAEGTYHEAALAEVNHILRDYRTDEEHVIDVRLLDLLWRLGGALESGEAYHVVSGYRSPKTNEMLRRMGAGVAKKSLHIKGQAIDVSLPGRALATLRDTAKALRGGGVGYYPKPGFVHIDVGRVRYW